MNCFPCLARRSGVPDVDALLYAAARRLGAPLRIDGDIVYTLPELRAGIPDAAPPLSNLRSPPVSTTRSPAPVARSAEPAPLLSGAPENFPRVPSLPASGSSVVRVKSAPVEGVEQPPPLAPAADRAALSSAATALHESLHAIDNELDTVRARLSTERAVARLLRFVLDRSERAGPCAGVDLSVTVFAAAGAFAQSAARTALNEASVIVNETDACLARMKDERSQMLEILCDAAKAVPPVVLSTDQHSLEGCTQALVAASAAIETQVTVYAKHISHAANFLVGGERAIAGLVSAASHGCSVAGDAASSTAAGTLETALLSLLARNGAALSLSLSLVNEADSTISVVAEASSSLAEIGARARKVDPRSEEAGTLLAHGALRAHAAGILSWLERAIRAWRAWSAQIEVLGDVIVAAVRADIEMALAAMLPAPPSASAPAGNEALRKRLATAVIVAKRLSVEAGSMRARRGELVEHIAASASRVYASRDGRQSICTASVRMLLNRSPPADSLLNVASVDANSHICECAACAEVRAHELASIRADIVCETVAPIDEELRVHVPQPPESNQLRDAKVLLGPIATRSLSTTGRLPDALRKDAAALALKLHCIENHRRALLSPGTLVTLARIPAYGSAATGSPRPLPESAVRIVLAATAYCAPLGVMLPASVGTLSVFGVNTGAALSPHALALLEDLSPDSLHTVTMTCADIEAEAALNGAAADEKEAVASAVACDSDTERTGCIIAEHEGVHWIDVVNSFDAAHLEQLALAEATKLVPLGDALALFDEVTQLGALNAALDEQERERSNARSRLTRARAADSVSASDSKYARAKEAVAKQRSALRGVLPALEEALAHHTHTRVGALEMVERLLGGAPVGAASFAAPALATLHAFVRELCAAERAAAKLAAAIKIEADDALEDER